MRRRESSSAGGNNGGQVFIHDFSDVAGSGEPRNGWRRASQVERDLATTTATPASTGYHGIEPWSYLRDLFCLITEWSVHRLLELAPLNWKKTAAVADVQALLDANLYRRLTLARD